MTTKHVTPQFSAAAERLATEIRNPFELMHELEFTFDTFQEYEQVYNPIRAKLDAKEITWSQFMDLLQAEISKRTQPAEPVKEAAPRIDHPRASRTGGTTHQHPAADESIQGLYPNSYSYRQQNH